MFPKLCEINYLGYTGNNGIITQCSVPRIFIRNYCSITCKLSGIKGTYVGEVIIQQWFIDQVNGNEIIYPNHWNQSFLIRVPELDVEKLAQVINELVEEEFYNKNGGKQSIGFNKN